MKRVGKVLAVILFCLPILLLSGCGKSVEMPENAISLSMAIGSDGTIRQDLEFSMQTQKMRELGASESQISEAISNVVNAVNNLRNEFYLSFLVTYSMSPMEEYKIGQGVAISGCKYDEKYDEVYFSIIFASFGAWRYYHGLPQQQEEKEETFSIKFFDKTTSNGKFPFAGEFVTASEEKMTVGERYAKLFNDAISSALPTDVTSGLGKTNFVYDYATPIAALRSNADAVVRAGGLYHNIWIKDMSNYLDATLEVSLTKIYYKYWYLTIMLIAILVLSIGLIIIKIKNAKRK